MRCWPGVGQRPAGNPPAHRSALPPQGHRSVDMAGQQRCAPGSPVPPANAALGLGHRVCGRGSLPRPHLCACPEHMEANRKVRGKTVIQILPEAGGTKDTPCEPPPATGRNRTRSLQPETPAQASSSMGQGEGLGVGRSNTRTFCGCVHESWLRGDGHPDRSGRRSLHSP